MALRIGIPSKFNNRTLHRFVNVQTVSDTLIFRWTNLTSLICLQRFSSSKNEPERPKNVLQGYITADQQPTTGACYDKKPFKMQLEAG